MFHAQSVRGRSFDCKGSPRNLALSNLVVFHNVVSMTRIFQELVNEGYTITPEILAKFSPYRTEHLNRFGSYDVRFDQEPLPITETLRLSPDLTVRMR